LAALEDLGFGFANLLLGKEVARRPVTMIGDSPSVDILRLQDAADIEVLEEIRRRRT
jgi:hypothetical protein